MIRADADEEPRTPLQHAVEMFEGTGTLGRPVGAGAHIAVDEPARSARAGGVGEDREPVSHGDTNTISSSDHCVVDIEEDEGTRRGVEIFTPVQRAMSLGALWRSVQDVGQSLINIFTNTNAGGGSRNPPYLDMEGDVENGDGDAGGSAFVPPTAPSRLSRRREILNNFQAFIDHRCGGRNNGFGTDEGVVEDNRDGGADGGESNANTSDGGLDVPRRSIGRSTGGTGGVGGGGGGGGGGANHVPSARFPPAASINNGVAPALAPSAPSAESPAAPAAIFPADAPGATTTEPTPAAREGDDRAGEANWKLLGVFLLLVAFGVGGMAGLPLLLHGYFPDSFTELLSGCVVVTFVALLVAVRALVIAQVIDGSSARMLNDFLSALAVFVRAFSDS